MEGTHGAAGRPDTVELLWSAGAGRGRSGLSRDRVVATAIDIADAEGLEALSMRRVADRLGFTAMSLYRHVPGKTELIDLMRDAVVGELDHPTPDGHGWRGGLESWARAHWILGLRHPWLVHSAGTRRIPGPNLVADFDHALRLAERTGLPSSEVVAVVGLITGFVDSAARQVEEVMRLQRDSGISHEQWWRDQSELFARMHDYPAIGRHWQVGGFDAPEDPFDFGLARILDGVERLIQQRRDEMHDVKAGSAGRRCVVCAEPLGETARGRPQKYCSRACRQRAYRLRQRPGTGAGPGP